MVAGREYLPASMEETESTEAATTADLRSLKARVATIVDSGWSQKVHSKMMTPAALEGLRPLFRSMQAHSLAQQCSIPGWALHRLSVVGPPARSQAQTARIAVALMSQDRPEPPR